MILKLPKWNFNSMKIHSWVQAFSSNEVTSGITGVHRAYSWLAPTAPRASNHSADRPPRALRFLHWTNS